MADMYNFINSFIGLVWIFKIQIIGSLFISLTVLEFFYKRKKVKKEVIELKKQSYDFEIIIINLISSKMTDSEKFSIKEMLGKIGDEFREFKAEMRTEIKELVSTFHEYKQSNNERIAKLEGDQKLTAKTIAIYIGFISMFIMLVVNTYMSLK